METDAAMAAATLGSADGAGPAPRTVLAGLVGSGIQRSRTPAMHEAEGRSHGLRLVYRLFDTDCMGDPRPAVGDVVRAAELCGFAGLNVTFPYKAAVMDHLDALSEEAKAVGAVNTVVFRDGRRVGHNTDWWGFAESLRRGLPGVARDRVLLLGAGGAGGAVAQALVDSGVTSLLVFDTDRTRAEALVDRLVARNRGAGSISAPDSLDALVAGGEIAALDGVVNATPIGMAKLPGTPFPATLLDPRMWVADIVYFPLETQFLRAARAAGCRLLPGSGMAVYQAVRAFELFTGVTPDDRRMADVFRSLSGPEDKAGG